MRALRDRLLSAARYASETGLMIWEVRSRLDEFHRVATPEAILAALSLPPASPAGASLKTPEDQ